MDGRNTISRCLNEEWKSLIQVTTISIQPMKYIVRACHSEIILCRYLRLLEMIRHPARVNFCFSQHIPSFFSFVRVKKSHENKGAYEHIKILLLFKDYFNPLCV